MSANQNQGSSQDPLMAYILSHARSPVAHRVSTAPTVADTESPTRLAQTKSASPRTPRRRRRSSIRSSFSTPGATERADPNYVQTVFDRLKRADLLGDLLALHQQGTSPMRNVIEDSPTSIRSTLLVSPSGIQVTSGNDDLVEHDDSGNSIMANAESINTIVDNAHNEIASDPIGVDECSSLTAVDSLTNDQDNVNEDNADSEPTVDAQATMPASSNLFIGNLPSLKSNEEIKRLVEQKFSLFGKCEAKIMRNHGNMPHCFLQFYEQEVADQVFKDYGGTDEIVIDGRKIRIERTIAQRTLVVYKAGYSQFTREDMLRRFESFGQVEDSYVLDRAESRAFVESGQCGLVQFKVYSVAKHVVIAMRGDAMWKVETPRDGQQAIRSIQIGRAHSQSGIYVGNLHPETNEIQLRERFHSYGTIRTIRIHANMSAVISTPAYAFVDFENADEAEMAIAGENDQRFLGRDIKVERRHSRPALPRVARPSTTRGPRPVVDARANYNRPTIHPTPGHWIYHPAPTPTGTAGNGVIPMGAYTMPVQYGANSRSAYVAPGWYGAIPTPPFTPRETGGHMGMSTHGNTSSTTRRGAATMTTQRHTGTNRTSSTRPSSRGNPFFTGPDNFRGRLMRHL